MELNLKQVFNGAPQSVMLGSDEICFNNHYELLKALAHKYRSALIVSPYLFEDFKNILDDFGECQINLVTSLKPCGLEQLKKPHSIKSFADSLFIKSNIWPSIGIDQNLHSKCYVFYDADIPKVGVVTSANFTYSGLNKNSETGVIVSDTELLTDIVNQINDRLDYVEISEYQLSRIVSTVSAVQHLHSDKVELNVNIGLDNILNNYCTPSAGNRDITLRDSSEYYIKVSGVKDRPIYPEDRLTFDEPHSELTFAKSPSSISLGDCLLEVAVGGKCFLSYYSCASEVYERTEKQRCMHEDYDRWPYYVFANNLSLHYGSRWFCNPIYYDELITDFHKEHPNVSVTKAGGDHIVGAIQRGHSYIKVTQEFGRFVKSRIDAFEC